MVQVSCVLHTNIIQNWSLIIMSFFIHFFLTRQELWWKFEVCEGGDGRVWSDMRQRQTHCMQASGCRMWSRPVTAAARHPPVTAATRVNILEDGGGTFLPCTGVSKQEILTGGNLTQSLLLFFDQLKDFGYGMEAHFNTTKSSTCKTRTWNLVRKYDPCCRKWMPCSMTDLGNESLTLWLS